MVVLEIGIYIRIPIELRDDEVQVAAPGFGHVFDEQVPGHVTALDHALVHAENVAAPLRFIRAETAGRMENARPDQPSAAGLEAICL